MVVAGKIFRLAENLPTSEIKSSLSKYHVEETFEEGEYHFPVMKEVSNLRAEGKGIRGLYSHDFISRVYHRGQVIPQPRTVEALIDFQVASSGTFLTVLEKKRRANFIATQLSRVIYARSDAILEARISPETFREFHSRNPEETKIIFFDNVDIPNIDKLSLYGTDLIDTKLFEDYSKHGDPWYIVYRSKPTGLLVGLTRNCSVTAFSLRDKDQFIDYVHSEVFPLITKNKT
jgi:hypothetical protein